MARSVTINSLVFILLSQIAIASQSPSGTAEHERLLRAFDKTQRKIRLDSRPSPEAWDLPSPRGTRGFRGNDRNDFRLLSSNAPAPAPPVSTPSANEESSIPSIYAQNKSPGVPEESGPSKPPPPMPLYKYLALHWQWGILTTLASTMGFLFHKFIASAIEGGPVLPYGLVLIAYMALVSLVIYISYRVDKKLQKKPQKGTIGNCSGGVTNGKRSK